MTYTSLTVLVGILLCLPSCRRPVLEESVEVAGGVAFETTCGLAAAFPLLGFDGRGSRWWVSEFDVGLPLSRSVDLLVAYMLQLEAPVLFSNAIEDGVAWAHAWST